MWKTEKASCFRWTETQSESNKKKQTPNTGWLVGLLPKCRCHTYLMPFIVHCSLEEDLSFFQRWTEKLSCPQTMSWEQTKAVCGAGIRHCSSIPKPKGKQQPPFSKPPPLSLPHQLLPPFPKYTAPFHSSWLAPLKGTYSLLPVCALPCCCLSFSWPLLQWESERKQQRKWETGGERLEISIASAGQKISCLLSL